MYISSHSSITSYNFHSHGPITVKIPWKIGWILHVPSFSPYFSCPKPWKSHGNPMKIPWKSHGNPMKIRISSPSVPPFAAPPAAPGPWPPRSWARRWRCSGWCPTWPAWRVPWGEAPGSWDFTAVFFEDFGHEKSRENERTLFERSLEIIVRI